MRYRLVHSEWNDWVVIPEDKYSEWLIFEKEALTDDLSMAWYPPWAKEVEISNFRFLLPPAENSYREEYKTARYESYIGGALQKKFSEVEEAIDYYKNWSDKDLESVEIDKITLSRIHLLR
jgi:hypothetical protein